MSRARTVRGSVDEPGDEPVLQTEASNETSSQKITLQNGLLRVKPFCIILYI
jgi:hypothetical protein